MLFEGKVCALTGGALGIGRCLAQRFAAEGAAVAFLDRDRAAGEAVLHGLRESGARALFVCGDAADPAALERFARETVEAFGRVDFLLNNACLSRGGLSPSGKPEEDCGYEDFLYVLRVGVAAPYWLTKLFAPHFAPGAAVVNLSSTRAGMSQPGTESYSAAKGGVAALTHAMAASLAHRARVNAISPGWIDTGEYHEEGTLARYARGDAEQHPAGRVGVPEDVAEAAVFLCRPESGFVDGADFVVDGGMTRLMIYHGDHGWTFEGEGV